MSSETAGDREVGENVDHDTSRQGTDATDTTGSPPLESEVPNDTEPLVRGEDAEPAAVTIPTGDVSRAHLKGLIEALVFVSDRPVSILDIAKAAGKADRKLVRSLVDELRFEYARRGIHLEEVAGGLLFRTNPAYGPFIRDVAAKKPVRMTRAQLETLAIIAYRQPLTRPEVDEIRGVDSGPVMKMLLDRDLVKILGKKDEPGRPLLYGTSAAFLEFFGLKSLKDMPSLREFTELSDDSRRVYQREMADAPEETTAVDVDGLARAASAAGDGASAEEPVTSPSVEGGVSEEKVEDGESAETAGELDEEDIYDQPTIPSAPVGDLEVDSLTDVDLEPMTDRDPEEKPN